MPTFAQAIATQTAAQIRDGLLLPQLTAFGSPVAGVPTSSPDRGIIEAEANFLASEAQLRAAVAASISPTTALSAGDSWVDAVVGWYGGTVDVAGNVTPTIQRIPALAAVWLIGVQIPPALVSLTIQPGSLLQVQAVTGQVFNLVLPAGSAPIVLNSASSFKASITLSARLPGAANGNVTPGDIQTFITAPAGLFNDPFHLQILITAGRDAETSISLITRALGSLGRAGAGWTLQALDYWIPFFAPTVTQWMVRDDNFYGPGSLGIVLANAAGPATATERNLVFSGLSGPTVRPLGTAAVMVTSSVAHVLNVVATLATDGSNATLHANAIAALAQVVSVWPLGGTLDPSLLTSVLRGDAIFSASVVLASGVAKLVQLGLVGFGGVTGVTHNLASPLVLVWNESLSMPIPSITP
jgi:hypothetical protein